MPSCTASWDNPEQTVILQIFDGELQWNQYAQTMQETKAMLDSAERPVDIISDVSTIQVPAGILTHYSEFAAAPGFKHPRAGRFVIVTGSEFVLGLVQVFRRMYGMAGMRVHVAPSIQQARSLLKETAKQSKAA